jgi:hypothetical protein
MGKKVIDSNWRLDMLKLIKSGWAFTILALVCLTLDLVFQSGSLFLILGIIFLALAILMRARFSGKTPPAPPS